MHQMNKNTRGSFHPRAMLDENGNLHLTSFDWCDDAPLKPEPVIHLDNRDYYPNRSNHVSDSTKQRAARA